MQYTTSREDYLISIYLLQRKNGSVRSIDVARMLGFTRPSVYKGIRFLMRHGLIMMDAQKLLTLTEAGRAQAEAIYRRYRIVLAFLEALGVSEQAAHQDACCLEHVLSEETLERMKSFAGEAGSALTGGGFSDTMEQIR